MKTSETQALWVPEQREGRRARILEFSSFVQRAHGINVDDYSKLWDWSVSHDKDFWAAIWDSFGVGKRREGEPVRDEAPMPHTTWFQGAHVNYAEYLLSQGADDAVAVIGVDENGRGVTLKRSELREQVRRLAGYLQMNGIREGDVVVGYLPNIPEAIVGFLATALLGATWSSVGQDYAAAAVADRFEQLSPRLLITADGYTYSGRWHDRRGTVAEIQAALPTLQQTIMIGRRSDNQISPPHVDWDTALQTRPYEQAAQLPFDHPLWVLFSSGTTGLPKGLVHGHGGILLESLKQMALHWDLGEDDVLFWYTSPSWVMWNLLVSALATGAAVVCYDGSPTHPDAGALWRIVEDNGVTYLGASPGLLQAVQAAGIRPGTDFDLSSLRSMGSTGSPLPKDLHRWAAEGIGPIPLWSISGGTDICSAFVGGAPTLPVWAGELSARCLGVALEAWGEDGRPLVDDVGEMVITKPIPSMPLHLWGDREYVRYVDTYLSTFPGVWRQGDWITISERGTVVIHGRSDSTLNRNGVRMGSADIYAAVESIPEVAESLVLGVEGTDGDYWMPLFVQLREPGSLDADLKRKIAAAIREKASPRHVPDDVFEVPGIPHTRTGKKLEVPLKRLFQGADREKVINPDTVDDPSLIEAFEAYAAIRR